MTSLLAPRKRQKTDHHGEPHSYIHHVLSWVANYIPKSELLGFSLICGSAFKAIKNRIDSLTFRVPPWGKMSVYSPREIIVQSHKSIHLEATHVICRYVTQVQLNEVASFLPSTVTQFSFQHCEDSVVPPYHFAFVSLKLAKLPPSITSLSFGMRCCQHIDGQLPVNLKKLWLGYHFDCQIDNLPQTLTHLVTGYYFNKRIDNLPPELTHLTTGYSFNKPIDHLPQKLSHLTLGERFNQPIDNLPLSLTWLTLGFDFNLPVDKLPPMLTHFTTGALFNQPVQNLPPSITHLRFGIMFDHPPKLPPRLTHLYLEYDTIMLCPPTLVQLSIGSVTIRDRFFRQSKRFSPKINYEELIIVPD